MEPNPSSRSLTCRPEPNLSPLLFAPRLIRMNEQMRAPKHLEPSRRFVDPRLQRGFDPGAWPLCNSGASPPVGAEDLYERRCIEFLAAYYELNRLNRRLLATRTRAGTAKAIRSLRFKIKKASAALENLEDRYAPIGFFGEPAMDGVFYRDIAFFRPELPRVSPALQSSHIAAPGLDDIPANELRGPVKIIRFGRGKVDL
jgi:hypothetical protein